jgi:outer membrane protein OmpA-like peptidoglycan-associated protein
LEDAADACPDQKGSYNNNGCPDDDEDGVPNHIDNCPDRPGIAINKGCPDGITPTPATKKLTPDLLNQVKEISKNIIFKLNSFEIDSLSKQNLDQLADIMLKDKALQLIIRSYTDNTGNRSQNLELSLARANAVKNYLVKKGLDDNRIYAFGYGQANPVASNATEEGRAQNRRIEFHLYYR